MYSMGVPVFYLSFYVDGFGFVAVDEQAACDQRREQSSLETEEIQHLR